jgi:hypothetical protein
LTIRRPVSEDEAIVAEFAVDNTLWDVEYTDS